MRAYLLPLHICINACITFSSHRVVVVCRSSLQGRFVAFPFSLFFFCSLFFFFF
ncbi:hypothetical protein F4809DRAFT_613092 [Biscogniauxia mediterranea]|nr:hypothetical protein F4809DRAFT_613092 [Biscogniauxia mediterranea]